MTEEITPGQILEALNDKADRDLSNITVGGGVDYVIDYQRPSAQNNYTWYRKYASGWVEQGGERTYSSLSGNVMSITLAIPMQNSNYTAQLTAELGASDTYFYCARITSRESTQLNYYMYGAGTISTNACPVNWRVEGIAA